MVRACVLMGRFCCCFFFLLISLMHILFYIQMQRLVLTPTNFWRNWSSAFVLSTILFSDRWKTSAFLCCDQSSSAPPTPAVIPLYATKQRKHRSVWQDYKRFKRDKFVCWSKLWVWRRISTQHQHHHHPFAFRQSIIISISILRRSSLSLKLTMKPIPRHSPQLHFRIRLLQPHPTSTVCGSRRIPFPSCN